MVAVEKLGELLALPTSPLSMCQVNDRLIIQNGYGEGRILTSGGRFVTPGLDPPTAAPNVEVTSPPQAGWLLGKWYFFSQFYSSTRGVPSNLSPASAEYDAGTTGTRVRIKPANIGENGNPGLIDRIRIHAMMYGQQIKRIGEIAATDRSGFIFGSSGLWPESQPSYNAIVEEDFVTNAAGSMDQPVSIGFDPIPSMKHQAYCAGRWWGAGQDPYPSAGTEVSLINPIHDELHKYAGRWRTQVFISAIQSDGTDYSSYGFGGAQGLLWRKSGDGSTTYIRVEKGGNSILFVIDGYVVARITRNGTVYLRGRISGTSEGPPVSRPGPIEWSEWHKAICINAMVTPWATWQSAMRFYANGDLRFDGATTLVVPGDSSLGYPFMTPIFWFVGAFGSNVFLNAGGELGAVNDAGALYWWDLAPSSGRFWCESLVENATPAQLCQGQSIDRGMLYRPFVLNGVVRGSVYAVASTGFSFWLAEEISLSAAELTIPQIIWDLLPLEGVAYSRYGYCEGGYFGESLQQELMSTLLTQEFDHEGSREITALRTSAMGLEVCYPDAEYLIIPHGGLTPLGELEVIRKKTNRSVIAPQSVAETVDRERIAVIGRLLSIGVTAGMETMILTDTGNRRLLTVDGGLSAMSLIKGVGEIVSLPDSARYVLANLDLANETAGDAGVVGSFGPNGLLFSQLRDMPIRALRSLRDEWGREKLLYGDALGVIGELFADRTDAGFPQAWRYRFYFSPLDLQQFIITGLRLFANWEREPWYVSCQLWAVPAKLTKSALLGALDVYESDMVWFTHGNTNSILVSPPKALPAAAVVIEFRGQESFLIRLKGLEIRYLPTEDKVGGR